MKARSRQRFDVIVDSGHTEIREKKLTPEANRNDTWYYLGLVGEIGFAIALPIAAGGIGGAYIDKVFGSTPKATILFLLVGIGISFVGFFHVIGEVIHKRTH